jgi:hypothetical protein
MKYQYLLYNSTEERGSHLLRGRSVKTSVYMLMHTVPSHTLNAVSSTAEYIPRLLLLLTPPIMSCPYLNLYVLFTWKCNGAGQLGGNRDNRLAIVRLTLRLLMSYTYIYMEHLFLMFLDHTQRRSTVGRTPLDE